MMLPADFRAGSSQWPCILILLLTPALATADEKPATILKGHDDWVSAVAFSPDGKTLASAGADKVVRLWSVADGLHGVLKGHTDGVYAVAFSPDGKTVATGSFDHTVKLWDIQTQREKPVYRGVGHRGVVLSVAFHPEAPFLASGSVDGSFRVISLFDKSKQPVEYWLNHKSWVNSVAFSRDGNLLATGSSDGTVRLCDASRLRTPAFPTSLATLEGGAGEIRCVAFSPDNKLLAAGNRYGTVRVWDVASRKEKQTLKGHASDVWAIAFSPDGKTLATADTDWKKPSRVKLWDTTTWRERGTLSCPGEILCLAYSPKGDSLAVGSWDRSVRLFATGR